MQCSIIYFYFIFNFLSTLHSTWDLSSWTRDWTCAPLQWKHGVLTAGGCCCSVAQSCPTLCTPMDCGMPGFPVLHCLWEFAQTRVHWVNDAIQPCHPLSPTSPSALNLSQHQGLFQWVVSSQQVAEVLVLQFQHPSYQWIFRVDFL